MDWEVRLRAALDQGVGPGAEWREGQLEAILAAIEPGGRTLVVQRTGWGKSLVYFVATRLLRDVGCGPTILVSPLLALMRNQKDTAARLNLRAVSIDSTNRDEWAILEHELEEDRVDILLVSPERLGNPDFAKRTLPMLERRCRLLVIDEAHCISDWGHDFRPDYRRILDTVHRLPADASVLGTTATANDRVIADVRLQLGSNLKVLRGPLMRESLRLRVVSLADQAERYAFLAKFMPKLPGSGLVYTLTVNDARRLAQWLRDNGIDARCYHADLPHEERVALENAFQRNEVKVLCATTALGMGYDKADVSFVIHFQRPGSVIAYYQQIGRAGRALDRAEVVLLEGSEDDEINTYFIESAFPDEAVFAAVRSAVRGRESLSLDECVASTNASRGQVEKALKLMEVSGALVRDGGRYRLGAADWHHGVLRSAEVIAARRRELEQMREYAQTTGCRMEFLARALDDPDPHACGKCDRCANLPLPTVPHDLVVAAMRALQRHAHTIRPRKRFPAGAFGEGLTKIPSDLVLEAGIALSVYGDAGWGKLVRTGKYETGRYPDELLTPCTAAIAELPHPIEWLTWIPSLRHPNLVADFARRLAGALGIPTRACVTKQKVTPEQKEMRNSTRQFLNAWEAFEVDGAQVLPGTCLLLDDIVDSGWTLTAVGARLRKAGSGPVVPFALASARPRDDV